MQTAIIFDMDGTLFQTNLILEPALERTFEYLRQNKLWTGATPIDEYREIMGVPLDVVWKTLCPNHSDKIREKSNYYFQSALIEEIRLGNGALYENVVSTLQILSKSYPLFIASNGETAYLQAIMSTFKLNRWIQKCYSIDIIPSRNKSHLVEQIKQEQNIVSGFVVGDRASDITAAIDNNLLAIAVNFDFAQHEEIKKAHHIIAEFPQLIDILNLNRILEGEHD
ncbi:predicted phosphatase [Solibacillus silvestris StLB046]|uniref:Predicted phosphatase n=1 Tax=Solibacillus silvestris (strain StLB046) TaxID=1002809 RepID=F2F4S9_SOLSS|nr:HAD hydrolase-like protein [Solibacillus silvestris]OBW60412.1 nucleosidase [Solibacillus silvestris]BAK16494.1 predicted phosphatase [Solibacillus silvestris StLB046]